MTAIPVADARTVRRSALLLLISHPAHLLIALLVYAGAVVAGLVSPYLLGQLVQQISEGNNGLIDLMSVSILGAIAVQAILLWLATWLTSRLAERIAAELREKFVVDLIRTPLTRVEAVPVGDLVARSTRDVNSVVQVASQSVPSLIVTGLTICATLVALLALGWFFMGCLVVALPLLLPTVRWYLRRSRAGYLAEHAAYAEMTQTLMEDIAGAETVARHSLQEVRRAAVHRTLAETYRAERHTLMLRSFFLPITDTAIALPTAAVLLVGGLAYFGHLTSLAAVTTAALYTVALSGQIDLFLYQQDKLQVGSAALARLLGLNALSEGETPGRSIPEGPLRLALRDISFCYVPGVEVLHDISLEITDGERIAIVGQSGAGKSTLARLLAGIDHARHGDACLNGVPLREIARDALNRRITILSQHGFVFDGSIRDNLLIAAPHASESRLHQVLESVGGHGMLDAFGLDNPIVNADRGLTPAEQQQLALARLALADPGIVILDEATSQFDPRIARGMERSIGELLKGRTVVSIAHRLHSAEDADRVLVMEDGRIVEDGTHASLLRCQGRYADLWRAWRGEGMAS